MSMMKHGATAAALVAMAFCTTAGAAKVSGTTGGIAKPAAAVKQARPAAAAVSPRERGKLAGQFVRKWGLYVQRMYGVPVGTWATRMAPTFANVDGRRLAGALQRTTFEGAMAELRGMGGKISDAAVVDQLARTPQGQQPKVLLASVGDLVFTPLAPCTIVDTRNSLGGGVLGTIGKSFSAVDQTTFVGQGGSASDCGTNGVDAQAVVLNVTAYGSLTGHATLHTYGTPRPPMHSLSFTRGEPESTQVVLPVPAPMDRFDFTLYASTRADFVVDVVGYYAPPPPPPPTATPALECTTTFATQSIPAGGIFNIEIPACPQSYTVTGAGCRTPGFNEATWAINGIFSNSGGAARTYCSGTNVTGGSITVEGTAQCCRVGSTPN